MTSQLIKQTISAADHLLDALIYQPQLFHRVSTLSLMASVRVFRTAELCEHILSYADRSTLARCARVCKLWSEPALDILWRGRIPIDNFLKILHPQVRTALLKHHFERCLISSLLSGLQLNRSTPQTLVRPRGLDSQLMASGYGR